MRLANVAKLAVVAVVVMLAGCSSNNKGKIEGTKWANQAGSVKGQQIPAGIITLEFTSDGKLRYVAGFTTWTGTYSLGFGNTVTFNTDQDLGGRKKNVQTVIIDNNVLTLRDSDGTQLLFNKQ